MTVNPGLSLWAAQLTQETARVAAHSSSPTTNPVPAADPILPELAARRLSRHTLDIRV